jgi:hypothetical protein
MNESLVLALESTIGREAGWVLSAILGSPFADANGLTSGIGSVASNESEHS